jgi:hypothetical protein
MTTDRRMIVNFVSRNVDFDGNVKINSFFRFGGFGFMPINL